MYSASRYRLLLVFNSYWSSVFVYSCCLHLNKSWVSYFSNDITLWFLKLILTSSSSFYDYSSFLCDFSLSLMIDYSFVFSMVCSCSFFTNLSSISIIWSSYFFLIFSICFSNAKFTLFIFSSFLIVEAPRSFKAVVS